MSKNRPATKSRKLRDRRGGLSPYAKYHKRPYRYTHQRMACPTNGGQEPAQPSTNKGE